ncbi:hypothetical protein ACHQM5_010813 [Ranunculus cassubicifolius]
MASSSHQIALLTLIIFFNSHTTSTATPKDHFTAIFAFGDSYTDTGNTRSNADSGPNGFRQVSYPPYGMTHFGHPTNRYSDGRLVIDFVAESLLLPYLPPYLNQKADKTHGVNFAVAGSTAIKHEFFVRNNLTLNTTPQSLLTQLTWFKSFLKNRGCQDKKSPTCNGLVTDSLFWIGEIGANDYAYNLGKTVPETVIQKLTMESITLFLQELLSMGAKYIVVQGIPPTGCLPLAMALGANEEKDKIGCLASVNNQSSRHNSLLQDRLDYFRKQYPHAIISYADYYNAYHMIMENSTKYGFREPFMACCGTGGPPLNFDLFNTCGSPKASKACSSPAQYINWDGVHLTEDMYKVVSDLFLHGGYTRPSFDFLKSSRRQEG